MRKFVGGNIILCTHLWELLIVLMSYCFVVFFDVLSSDESFPTLDGRRTILGSTLKVEMELLDW